MRPRAVTDFAVALTQASPSHQITSCCRKREYELSAWYFIYLVGNGLVWRRLDGMVKTKSPICEAISKTCYTLIHDEELCIWEARRQSLIEHGCAEAVTFFDEMGEECDCCHTEHTCPEGTHDITSQ